MTYNEKKKAYNQEYTKAHYKRIPLDVKNEKYEEIKAAADSCNEKVNEFIKKAIDNRLKTMSKTFTITHVVDDSKKPESLTLKVEPAKKSSKKAAVGHKK